MSLLFACKKSNPTPVPTPNSGDTTKVVSNDSVPCVENSSINFSCIGNPIGSFGPCIKDIDGNVYKTVIIGKQRWMAENLKTSKYNDGTAIPNVTDNKQWFKLKTGAWAYYNNDTSNNLKYGKLYNWYVVSPTTNVNKNVCPTGWHVPTTDEWFVLNDYLDHYSPESKMEEVGTTSWNSPNVEATNSSLFTGLPGGLRSDIFLDIGINGNWWSSSSFKTDSGIEYNDFFMLEHDGFGMENIGRMCGLSIRCLKD